MSTALRTPADCAAIVENIDWAATQLGPYETWPERLKGYLAMVLEMPTPAIIFWGPDQVQLYNNGYSVIMGPRHPTYFGATYQECWPDTYPVIYPWMQRVLQGEVIEVEDTLFVLTRHGFTEEAYFTFTFSPLRDDSGAIAGILQPVVETTHRVLGQRRADTLRSLSLLRRTSCSPQELVDALFTNPKDVAFAKFYPAGSDAPERVATVLASGQATTCPAIDLLGREHRGTWDEPTDDAYLVAVQLGDQTQGVLAIGLSPRLRFDADYRAFCDGVARELAASLEAQAAREAEQALSLRAEAARAEAEQQRRRLHSVFMQAPVAITILTGPSYVVEMANPRCLQLWGRELSDVLDKPLFSAMPEIAGQGLEQLLDKVRGTATAVTGTELPVKIRLSPGADLQQRYFNFVYDPLLDTSGTVTGVIVVAVDVTVHVLARQAAEQLAAELDTSRRDAESARDAAQAANRSKDEFLAMLGHELRNPLAPIFTAVELLRMRGSSSRECEVIERQARHLASLVEDLLDVSRITSGKVELKRQDVELADVIAKAIETSSPVLETRRHELQVDVPPGLVVDADPARLTQVFANLVTNAAKYTDSGGRVTVTAKRADGVLTVEVSDNGRGIAPDMLPRIFDRFVQERQNIDRAQGGLGLGLTIVRSLVQLHGGTVEARSEGSGRGSTFVVSLPAVAQTTVSTRPSRPLFTPTSDVLQQSHKILIVDDNEDAALLLAEALAASGYNCAVAHDGLRALELAKTERFDAVLLDIGLPAMDGYEVARHARALPGWNDVRLVAITGYGQTNDRERSLEAGFDHHMVKPVDMHALTKLLASHLGRE